MKANDAQGNPVPSIRRGNPQDASLLAELGARTFTETFAADNSPQDLAAYISKAFNPVRQLSELNDPASTFLIAEIDDTPVGYAQIYAGTPEPVIQGAKPVELVRLYLSRAWLGRGLGDALMRASIDHALAAGYKTLWLGVWEHNARAQAFYRKWNFRAVGHHVFQLGSDAQTDILMERAL